MSYLIALFAVLSYTFIRYIVTQASGIILAGLGLYYLWASNNSTVGAIMLIGGALAAAYQNKPKDAN